MAKITQKSMNTLLKVYRNQKTDVTLHMANPENPEEIIMEISVKNELSIEDKGNFIDRVVNACFDTDGDFIPQYLDPVFMITLLQMTTNVPVFEREIELDDGSKTTVIDIEKTYELCKAINLIHNVKDNAFQALVAELRGMTVEKLDYMKQMRFCAEERMLSKAREELENGVAMVAAIGQQLNETLANASGLNNMAEAMKNFDYDKMVDSVLSHK
jgi:hypothetical protein